MTPDHATDANETSRAPRAASLVWLIASLLLLHWSLPVAAGGTASSERSPTAERGVAPAARTARPQTRLRDLAKTMALDLRAKDGKSQISTGGDVGLAAAPGEALSTSYRPTKAPDRAQRAPGEVRAFAFEARAPPQRRV